MHRENPPVRAATNLIMADIEMDAAAGERPRVRFVAPAPGDLFSPVTPAVTLAALFWLLVY
jgi:hypothetical protein